MSGRIEGAFAARAAKNQKALITYLCVGDPDADASIALALACAEAGADVLELGCPFSDPTADGPVIARASQRALANGGGLDVTLRVARAIRERSPIPIVLFGYLNPLFVRGDEAAVDLAAEAGVDAFLVVDLPIDESAPLREAAAKKGIGVVPLVAPTTTDARITAIAEVARAYPCPFAYYVSTTGVTGGGGREAALADAAMRAAQVRSATGLPTVVGFGIDSPDRARIAAGRARSPASPGGASEGADGVVVGSAIVSLIEKHGAGAKDEVSAFVKSLRDAV